MVSRHCVGKQPVHTDPSALLLASTWRIGQRHTLIRCGQCRSCSPMISLMAGKTKGNPLSLLLATDVIPPGSAYHYFCVLDSLCSGFRVMKLACDGSYLTLWWSGAFPGASIIHNDVSTAGTATSRAKITSPIITPRTRTIVI